MKRIILGIMAGAALLCSVSCQAAFSLTTVTSSYTTAEADIVMDTVVANSNSWISTASSYATQDTAVSNAFIAADVVVSSAFAAADTVVSNAFVAADVVLALATTATSNAFVSADTAVSNVLAAVDATQVYTNHIGNITLEGDIVINDEISITPTYGSGLQSDIIVSTAFIIPTLYGTGSYFTTIYGGVVNSELEIGTWSGGGSMLFRTNNTIECEIPLIVVEGTATNHAVQLAQLTAADTVVSNAFIAADIVLASATTATSNAFVSADTAVSNAVTAAFVSADTAVSNAVIASSQQIAGGRTYPYTDLSISSGYNVLSNDYILNVTRTADGTCGITIPTLQNVAGRVLIIKDAAGNSSTYAITIDCYAAAGEIDGSTAGITITNDYGKVSLYCDGSNWFTY